MIQTDKDSARIQRMIAPVAPPEWFAVFNPTPGTYRNWRIETKAGPLELTFYRTWIAGRFENIPRALEFVDCNQFTGKWNFLGEDCEQELRHWLELINH